MKICRIPYKNACRTGVRNLFTVEGLHDAIRSYTRMIFPLRLVSLCVAWYREKQQNTLLFWIYFIKGFKISTEYVC